MTGESLSGIRRPSGRLFFCPESGRGRGRDRSGRAGGPPPEGEGGGSGRSGSSQAAGIKKGRPEGPPDMLCRDFDMRIITVGFNEFWRGVGQFKVIRDLFPVGIAVFP